MFKVFTGYQDHQFFSIDADELHKVYYVYLVENARTILNNGRTIMHKEILKVEPDNNAVFGWLPDYKISGEDFIIIKNNKTIKKMQYEMALARDIVYKIDTTNAQKVLQMPMQEVAKLLQVERLILN